MNPIDIPTMNGATVLFATNDAIYLRIPSDIAQPINGGCACNYCKANPDMVPKWDALCIPIKRKKGKNWYAHTVHMPNVGTHIDYLKSTGKKVRIN